jgi:hypothetical protein
MLDHDESCGFPQTPCDNRDHKVLVHKACGKPIQVRFCGCRRSDHGYTFDPQRGWWVHYVCGWPTRAWFEANGKDAPLDLQGVKPTTYHEYQPVPKVPKQAYEALTEEQRRANEVGVGTWVRD